MRPHPGICFRLLFFALALAARQAPPVRAAGVQDHDLVIFAVDGLGSACLLDTPEEKLPEYTYWKAQGTASHITRASWPADCAANWGSILWANPITTHGVSSRFWNLIPSITGETPACDFKASIFQAVKAYAGDDAVQTHVFTSWNLFKRLLRSAPVDVWHDAHDDAETERNVQTAWQVNRAAKPGVYFIYFSNVYENGGASGWCSSGYRQALERTFARIARLRAGLQASGGRPWSAAIVSDHGGDMFLHSLRFERQVLQTPMLFLGANIASGRAVTRQVWQNYQAFPTLFAAAGYPHPPDWPVAPPAYTALVGNYTRGVDAYGESIYPPLDDPALPECTFIYPFHLNIWAYALPWLGIGVVAMALLLTFFMGRDFLRLFTTNVFVATHNMYKISAD